MPQVARPSWTVRGCLGDKKPRFFLLPLLLLLLFFPMSSHIMTKTMTTKHTYIMPWPPPPIRKAARRSNIVNFSPLGMAAGHVPGPLAASPAGGLGT